MCDGTAYSRANYGQLYNVLGGAASPWGQGDGATTFNVPDLRGRAPIGAGQGGGLTSRVLAQIGGSELHTLTISEMPNHGHGLNWQDNGHNHNIQDFGHGHGVTDNGHAHQYATDNWPSGPYYFTSVAGVSRTVVNQWTDTRTANISVNSNTTGISVLSNSCGISASVQANGGGASFNLMQPWVAVNYIIKAAYNAPVGQTVPLADTTQPGLVTKMSGLSTDYVGGDNTTHDLGAMVRTVIPVIRSYNSLGNATFEADARTVGNGTNTGGGWAQDRWQYQNAGTNRGTAIQATGNVIVAGTSFCISSKFLRYTLTTQEGTLSAGSYITFAQFIEGSRLRELLGGPTSISVVARSSVASTVFGVALRDANNAYSIAQSAAITNANAWTLIPIVNYPLWTASGSFPSSQGVLGYTLLVTIACGATSMIPSNGVWTAGNYLAAQGTTNFAANPVNSTFDLGYILHEPGAVSNGVLDLDLQRNLRDTARYFQKSVPYATKPLQGNFKQIGIFVNGTNYARLGIQFPVGMAKAPTMACVGNAANLNYLYVDGIGNIPLSSALSADTSGCSAANFQNTYSPGFAPVLGEWTADTGW